MKPNIVLITVDCWRGDHIGKAHDAKVATPNIDKLANQSHYFDNAYSCGGWTKIAMTALFSSTHASMYGFTKGKLSDERPLLTEELNSHNYHTAGFTTNVVCGSPQGFNRGFKTFEDAKPDNDANRFKISKVRGFHRLSKYPLFHSVLSLLGFDSAPAYPSLPANELVDKALHWLDYEHDNREDQEQPYFLWLHFMDLHMPYRSSLRAKTGKEISAMWRDRAHWNIVRKSHGTHPVENQQSKRWQKLYAEETGFLDQQLGRLFSGLEKRSDWQNTALCLTADHGEEFYEHGTWAHSWNQLHDEGIRVPLLLHLPNQTQGQTINEPVSHLDITPTLLEIAGVPSSDKMLGTSYLTALQEKPYPDTLTAIVSEMHGHLNSYRYRLSVLYKNHRYIYDGDTDSCLLFHLGTDPKATNNIYNKEHPLASTFDRLRLAHISKGALAALKGNVHLGGDAISYDLDDDPAVLDRLRALGYLE